MMSDPVTVAAQVRIQEMTAEANRRSAERFGPVQQIGMLGILLGAGADPEIAAELGEDLALLPSIAQARAEYVACARVWIEFIQAAGTVRSIASDAGLTDAEKIGAIAAVAF